MKKIYGFAALCAAMTLASCSNNDEPIVNGGKDQVRAIGGYVSINIANSNATRADHNTFEYGTEAESKAKTATFVFFDDEGNYVTTMENQALTFTSASTTTPADNVEREYNVMVPIEVSIDNPNKDSEEGIAETKEKVESIDNVIVILNPTTDINTAVNETAKPNRDDVVAIVDNYGALKSDYGFVMSNSVYVGTDVVYGQSVAGSIKNSPLAATQSPVSLYVERVAARVDVKNGDNIDVTEKPGIDMLEYDNNGVLTLVHHDLDIKVTGVQLANVANKSYLVKNLETSYSDLGTTFGTSWNDALKFRSHWATSWTSSTYAAAPSRTESDQTSLGFTNVNYGGFDELTTDKYYINENTNQAYGTAIMVSAELGTKEGDTFTPLEIYRSCYDGRYYSSEAALNTLLAMLQREGYGIPEKDEDGNIISSTALTAADLGFKSAVSTETPEVDGKIHGFTGYLEFKEDKATEICKTVDGGVTYTSITAEDFVKNVLHSNDYKVWRWQDGKCYYYVYLTNGEDQNAYDEDGVPTETTDADGKTLTDKLRGVVRNHIYDVTLKSVRGLGVPVFDENDIIVPETPKKLTVKDDWNLACDIKILSWGYYSQNAEFGQGQDY